MNIIVMGMAMVELYKSVNFDYNIIFMIETVKCMLCDCIFRSCRYGTVQYRWLQNSSCAPGDHYTHNGLNGVAGVLKGTLTTFRQHLHNDRISCTLLGLHAVP